MVTDKMFDDSKIEKMDNLTCEFVKTIVKEDPNKAVKEGANASSVPKKQKTEPPVASDTKKSVLMAKILQKRESHAAKKVTFDSRTGEIREELMRFKFMCQNFDLATVLDNVGTPEYRKRVKNKVDMSENFDKKIITYFKDLLDPFFSWKNCGASEFPNLCYAALIILSKPSHNGFQECIFCLVLTRIRDLQRESMKTISKWGSLNK